MSLPLGATRIPHRSITTALDTFPLAGRNNTASTNDSANGGNVWRSNNRAANRQANQLAAAFDAGNFMAHVIGNDVRAWVQVAANVSLGGAYEAIRPNSIYFFKSSSSIDCITVLPTTFKPGDRITMVNLGTGYVDFFITGLTSVSAAGLGSTKIRLKAGGGANLGASITLEWNYLLAATPTLGWYVVNKNAVLGTVGDGNPLGIS
jgi:hypothetical protein